jgi:hypothetical protein
MSEPISGPMNKPQAPDDIATGGRQDDPDRLVESAGVAWNGREHRRLERYPVAGSRPIALRPLGPDGQPAGSWMLADILDISLGGLCLLITGSLELQPGQMLELDLRSHPNFPWVRVTVQTRWWISADSFSTLGLSFEPQLTTIPRLAMERRGQRRDPNQAVWATD